MLPFAEPPATAQVTPWFRELCTVAVNCCVCGGAFVRWGYRLLTTVGLTETLIGGGGGGCELPPPPQATIVTLANNAKDRTKLPNRFLSGRRASPNSTMPASGRLRSHKRRLSLRPLRCVPVNGPSV